MPLQKAKFYARNHHPIFPVAVKNRCPVVSHPTPFSILIIVELDLILNMKYLQMNVKQPTINLSIDEPTC